VVFLCLFLKFIVKSIRKKCVILELKKELASTIVFIPNFFKIWYVAYAITSLSLRIITEQKAIVSGAKKEKERKKFISHE
jgi:hypothetical protein